ncbi:GAF domain-containing sensor histidine kinase [Pseudoponticoccus marisrubri]|uniref:histidine kinase n=1 Tax=Pseudoponticoccus marisrubri TaxID=1685382 RepID=A0A0W7WLD7_9RHOB|nr:GAF domain-containing sensor histidine kinase [Pseudoponticoccus marisrubri]KUF11424.1 hypothetical protein AVJ23_06565 [Pseudoponticoccus marisrubri]
MTRAQITFPFASNEHARLREVREVVGRDLQADPVLQDITRDVSRLFGVPAALVSVVESDHQWFLAKTGIDLDSTPRDYAICSRAIMSDQPLILPDTLEHREFSNHPAVVLDPKVRFYVGAPLVLSSGFRVGTLCAIDVVAHGAPSQNEIDALQDLAALTVAHLEEHHARRTDGNQDRRAQIAADAQQEFLSLIGHEFRSPLTVLLGNARLLQHRHESAEGQPPHSDDFTRRALSGIVASGEHLHRLIERVIHFTNLQNGELFLAEETLPCAPFLRSVVDPIEPIVSVEARQVTTRCDETLSAIRGDGEQLAVALSALASNALTHGAGDIALVATRGDDNALRLQCRDEGPGCSEAQIARADRPFAVGEDVIRRQAGGLGLGLPLARKIAELHGGRLQAGRDSLSAWVEMELPSWRCSMALA